jgi:hypothetical protein
MPAIPASKKFSNLPSSAIASRNECHSACELLRSFCFQSKERRRRMLVICGKHPAPESVQTVRMDGQIGVRDLLVSANFEYLHVPIFACERAMLSPSNGCRFNAATMMAKPLPWFSYGIIASLNLRRTCVPSKHTARPDFRFNDSGNSCIRQSEST